MAAIADAAVTCRADVQHAVLRMKARTWHAERTMPGRFGLTPTQGHLENLQKRAR